MEQLTSSRDSDHHQSFGSDGKTLVSGPMEDLTEQQPGTASGAEASTRIQRILDQEVKES